ncbi:MAG TPA: DUF6709 family protein [Candidatus Acidoferrales bacterium]|jgi:hypothetical protein|nr:DUF6709 family protein [Candidatus Acidoferrales bacterium]
MSWVENEAGRANRNLLIVNVILGGAAGYGIYNVLSSTIREWQEYGVNHAWVPILILSPILALAVWNFSKAIQRYQKIEKAPVWRILAAYGQPTQLSSEIEQDLRAGSVKFAGLRITSRWLIKRNLFSTWTSPVSDVAWGYKTVTRHRTNGIPSGRTYSTVISGRHNQSVTIRSSEKKVDALMADLIQRTPWAAFGYSPELVAAWKKNHAGFVAAVDDRKLRLATK